MRRGILAIILGCVLLPGARGGNDLVGAPAPPLELRQWIHSPPLDVQALRGKVILIRWWTDGCSLCTATAPAVRKLQQKYAARGFQVIGVYHPKPPGAADLERVRRAAAGLGFTFPIAVDADWKALRRWWLNQGPRDFTSVSFVIDKRGIIRYIHSGGEFHEGEHASCRRDYQQIDELIERLLAE